MSKITVFWSVLALANAGTTTLTVPAKPPTSCGILDKSPLSLSQVEPNQYFDL